MKITIIIRIIQQKKIKYHFLHYSTVVRVSSRNCGILFVSDLRVEPSRRTTFLSLRSLLSFFSFSVVRNSHRLDGGEKRMLGTEL